MVSRNPSVHRVPGKLGCLFSALVLLAGFGIPSSNAQEAPQAVTTKAALKGKVLGGQQPVQNSEIRLFASGFEGYGFGSVLLTPPVYTDQDGHFLITASFTCPSASDITYLVSSGGDPGLGVNNPAIALMAVLGPCGSLASHSFVTIDEVTSVASIWAFNPFIGTEQRTGTSHTNTRGLTHAYAGFTNLVNNSLGTAPGTTAPAGAVIPVAKINTLANILAACVNSSGSGVCNDLFAAATPVGGITPNNTLQAALNIARNPALRVSTLFSIPPPASPYQPSLQSAPNDWTLSIAYKGGGLNSPGGISVDAYGDVWAADYFKAVSELSTGGQPVSPSAGYVGGDPNESYGIAVSNNGNVWVANEETDPAYNDGHGSLTLLSSTGAPLSPAGGYSDGGVFFPVAVATDTDGSVWTANYGNSTASHLSSTGTAISGSTGFGTHKLVGPVAVAVDASHYAWFANQSAYPGSVTRISPDGSQVLQMNCCGEEPSGIAIDAVPQLEGAIVGHVWVSNFASNSVSELEIKNTGSVAIVSTGYKGGGINHPNGLAVDGSGNIWVANYDGNSISELEGAKSIKPGYPLSPKTGLGSDANLSKPYSIAIDQGGNVWVSNFGSSTLSEFLGAATPVVTPLTGPAQLP
jgi:streptogramin lyase